MGGSGPHGEVTGAILAGGRARRFHGVNKATLDVFGRRIVDRQLAALRPVTAAQLIVANDQSAFESLGVRLVADAVSGAGPLGGLFTALAASSTPRVLVLACDLPFVDEAFLRYLIERAPEADAVAPRTEDGLQPLCAVYATRVMPAIQSRLAQGRLAVHEALDDMVTTIVGPAEVAAFDPHGCLLANVNTPAHYEALAGAR
jgi:molybdopterin-guanine dinucleotide biosynthesis protein A